MGEERDRKVGKSLGRGALNSHRRMVAVHVSKIAEFRFSFNSERSCPNSYTNPKKMIFDVEGVSRLLSSGFANRYNPAIMFRRL